MGQRPVVTVDDVTRVQLEPRRPGCEKGVMHVEGAVQTAVFRVAPGSGVPVHLHSQVFDLFIGIKGLLEIRYEGLEGNGKFELKPGGFCAMPPGVRHEVFNPSTSDEAVYLSVHAPHDRYDFIPVDFGQIAAALHDRQYVATQHAAPPDASR